MKWLPTNTEIQKIQNIRIERLMQAICEYGQPNPYLISLCQQFCTASSPEVEKQLKQSKWQDMYTIIRHPNTEHNIRVVCCSVLKWLIYHKKFVADPLLILQQLVDFYLVDDTDCPGLTKAQKVAEMVIQIIPPSYLKQQQKLSTIQHLLSLLSPSSPTPPTPKIPQLLLILIESVQPEHLNNQVISGQIFLILQKYLISNSMSNSVKLLMIKNFIKLVQTILDIINDQDNDLENNVVEEFLANSTLVKTVLEGVVVCDGGGTGSGQIISGDRVINQVKVVALQLYKSIWAYSLDQPMFKLCLSSLLTRPTPLLDQQSQLTSLLLILLQRSITTQQYYPHLHKSSQLLTISLLSLLKPHTCHLQQLKTQPQQYVEYLYDFCMEQGQDILDNRVGSLLSSLCLYVDGYLSFLGSLCIMTIKKFNGSIEKIDGGTQFMKIIQGMWTDSLEDKTAICVIVLAAISDQIQKRQDLAQPLNLELKNMVEMFRYPACQLPPYLICRFMLLYAYQGYNGCLKQFIPYKAGHPVYGYQLQSCLQILQRYSRTPQSKGYVQQILPLLIISNKLTPLLQTTIMSGNLASRIQFPILQKLVEWLEDGMHVQNYAVCNKMGNLLGIFIDRMQAAVFGYLGNLWKRLLGAAGQEWEQFLLEPAIAYVRKFPSLQKNPQRLMFFIDLGYKIIQRNGGVLNMCLDLFFEVTRWANYDLIVPMVQIYTGCLESQLRETDQWQCYYGLEVCMLRANELKRQLPPVNISRVIEKVQGYQCPVLKAKTLMFVMSALATSNENIPLTIQQLLISIVPYQSKPYLLYLLSLSPKMSQSPAQSLELLQYLLAGLKREKSLPKQLKTYEQTLYQHPQQAQSQVALDAFGITRKLLHPLLFKNIDLYLQFRRWWENIPNKAQLLPLLNQEIRGQLMQAVGQVTINHKVRKIYKVKHSRKQDHDAEMGGC